MGDRISVRFSTSKIEAIRENESLRAFQHLRLWVSQSLFRGISEVQTAGVPVFPISLVDCGCPSLSASLFLHQTVSEGGLLTPRFVILAFASP